VIRVVIVDDHPVVLEGLSAMIAGDPRMEVVGTATTVAGALALAPEPGPDVFVVDLHLPDGDGVTLASQLRQRWPSSKVAILTMSQEPAVVLRSLAEGVDSFLLKDAPPRELLDAILATANGSVVLSAAASESVRVAASNVPSTDPLARLDARDREILALLVEGLDTTQVATKLFLSPKTIRNRTSEILAKLGVATRADAITLGSAAGLGNRHDQRRNRPDRGG
jgi:DNA-binding NarL/FixJ family response regulator